MKRRAVGLNPRAGDEPAPVPALPAWKAFVVQFGREVGTTHGIFAGRVEHLSSGRRTHFSSDAELLAILRRMLDEISEDST